MQDYYAILGVSKTASVADIKTAFRTLAKLYHPDTNPTNPNAAVLFSQILKAYNVLVNPNSRRRYDHSTQSNTYSSKNYTPKNTQQNRYKEQRNSSQEELKKRDYYKTHYKHAEKKAQQQSTQTYSDYKYILYATPLAVGLLMLVMSMFTNEPSVSSNKHINLNDTLKTTTLQFNHAKDSSF